MDATTWQIISIVGYSLAGALLITAIVLFFKMKVPAIIGELTGRTAARQIQEIREHRGNKRHQPNVFDVDPGIVREPLVSEGFEPVSRPVMEAKGETEDHSRPTLLGSLPTEVLDQDEGGLYLGTFSEKGFEGTEILSDGHEERLLEKGERYSLTDVLNDGRQGQSPEKEERYSLTDVLAEERKEKPVSKEDRYALTDVLNAHLEDQPLENDVHYALTDVLNDEKKPISSEGRNAAPRRRASSDRVVPLSLTEILDNYKEGEPPTADAGNELLLSLTEVLSNEKEVTMEAKLKEREVLLSLTEILSTNAEKSSASVEVPKEVLLSLTEILSKNAAVVSASSEKGSKEALSVSTDERDVLRPRTEVLSDKKEDLRPRTDVLTTETEVLDYGTELLAEDQGTTVLYPTAELENESGKDVPAVSFKVVKDIKVTHTNKKI
ncbi:hypothetical protein QE429_000948 [Bacillus sp. SORGH_AS 510]|uniref:hypothetical protein n=1 Tax=Bacillus sp. SORGH_AS_0510 TaxID=3041771 RepID=UPI00278486CC|nr:hypothetical protein [Bacillus sp. SORGH_AS_0510]MDQ1144121.1 hypothetical protein [Bacillus sp. SORGH_AS_0510]